MFHIPFILQRHSKSDKIDNYNRNIHQTIQSYSLYLHSNKGCTRKAQNLPDGICLMVDLSWSILQEMRKLQVADTKVTRALEEISSGFRIKEIQVRSKITLHGA